MPAYAILSSIYLLNTTNDTYGMLKTKKNLFKINDRFWFRVNDCHTIICF